MKSRLSSRNLGELFSRNFGPKFRALLVRMRNSKLHIRNQREILDRNRPLKV
jgi:hypothetical protein